MRSGTVACIILAAGGSRRMGRPKQTLRVGGLSLLRLAAANAFASTCRPVVVAVGAHEALVTQELHALPVLIARNPDWERGIGASLRVAVEKLAQIAGLDVNGVVVTLADQPLVTAEHMDLLVKVQNRTGSDIVASQYAETRGVPAFFSRRLFADLGALDGDQGARHLIAHHCGHVETIPAAGAAFDVDTPADYEKLVRAWQRHRRDMHLHPNG